MDFIIKFLKSKDFTTTMVYNSIIVVVDKLIKYIHFILFIEMYNIEQLRHFYIDKIIRYQKILKNIINDRNKLFILMY